MTMVYVLICVIAIVFLPRLDMALYPDVDLPVISVMVSCNDAGPEEVELQVTETMEDALQSLQNLDTMTSVSREGMSMVILQFDYGTDLDEASEDVNSITSMMSRRSLGWISTRHCQTMRKRPSRAHSAPQTGTSLNTSPGMTRMMRQTQHMYRESLILSRSSWIPPSWCSWI